MSSYTCTRRFQFCTGHRVHLHESKCRNLHGHNYVAYVTVEHDQGVLDPLGRVVDFGVLKEIIGHWIDTFWDHRCVLFTEDTEAIEAVAKINAGCVYQMRSNPTAENMAEELFNVATDLLASKRLRVVKVVLYETENCYAEFSR